MQLNVEKVTPAKTGKSLRVQAGGVWYGANKDSGVQVGMVIEADIEDGDFGKWIKTYRAVGGAPASTAPLNKTAAEIGGKLSPVAPAWLPFASNTVAHAISSGAAKIPADVKPWAEAAKKAFEELA